MTVRRSSLNYRLWKRWHKKEGQEPKDLCRYFWFSVYQWTLGLIVMAFFYVFGGVVVALAYGVGWIVGYRVDWRSGSANLYCPYKHDLYNWKPRNRRYAVAPWEVLVSAAASFGVYRTYHFFADHPVSTLVPPPDRITLWVIAAVASMLLLAIVGTKLYQNDLVREYFKARKEKWCPQIEVID